MGGRLGVSLGCTDEIAIERRPPTCEAGRRTSAWGSAPDRLPDLLVVTLWTCLRGQASPGRDHHAALTAHITRGECDVFEQDESRSTSSPMATPSCGEKIGEVGQGEERDGESGKALAETPHDRGRPTVAGVSWLAGHQPEPSRAADIHARRDRQRSRVLRRRIAKLREAQSTHYTDGLRGDHRRAPISRLVGGGGEKGEGERREEGGGGEGRERGRGGGEDDGQTAREGGPP